MKTKIIHNAIVNIFFVMLSLVFILPIISIFSISLTSEADILEFGYRMIPRSLDTVAYEYVFKNPKQILDSYKVTILISVVGTLFSTLFMMMCSYTLARKGFKYKRIISFYLFFTLLFNGGLIPSYILTAKYLNLRDTIWVLILSGLVNVWYIFILRTFIQGIPDSIIESALIDGASEYRIFASLILPLSKPAIATIGLLNLFGYWNNWQTALLYIRKKELYPLQYLLQKIMMDIQAVIQNMDKTIQSLKRKFFRQPR